MSIETLKEIVKPPFANYDVVVYFGCGLFMIPFLNRYIVEPAGLKWPKFSIAIGSSLASELVSGLSLLFSIYILGHFIAYISSQFVEKLADRLLGKISTAIIFSSLSNARRRNEWIRALIFDRLRNISHDRATLPTLVRAVVHLPAFPLYIIVYIVGIFGYYNTRVPYSIIRAARSKLAVIGIGEVEIGARTKWFKPLEYYVINRVPTAVPRMYNYLVIGGLFRSLCVIFLFSLWLQLYYFVHNQLDGDYFVSPILGMHRNFSVVAEYLLVSLAYIFSLFSYIKFQRRYVEEAIFAFVFEPKS